MYSRKCHRLLYLKGTQQPFEVIRVVTVYYRLWAGVTYVMVSKGPRCGTGHGAWGAQRDLEPRTSLEPTRIASAQQAMRDAMDGG